jgi:hypothetical protein
MASHCTSDNDVAREPKEREPEPEGEPRPQREPEAQRQGELEPQ